MSHGLPQGMLSFPFNLFATKAANAASDDAYTTGHL